MRRLSEHQDRGVATLFVVLITPVLILCGTFVFDGGRGIVARGQVQGAADAGALAKATDCAKLPQVTNTPFTAYQTNGAVLANVPTCGSGTTTVTMQQTITSMFPLGMGPWVVTRSATAKWGNLGGYTGTFPLTISTCAYALAAGGIPGTLPTPDVTMHSNQLGCNGGPGQFGFLENGCDSSVTVNAGDVRPGTTGNNLNGTACVEADLVRYMTTDAFGFGVGNVLVPIWDSYSGGYHIAGWTFFHLTGYSLQGNKSAGTLGAHCDDGLGSNDTKECIRGNIVKFVTEQGSVGGSNFGVTQVYLFS